MYESSHQAQFSKSIEDSSFARFCRFRRLTADKIAGVVSMIALRYIYSDGFTNCVDLVELLGRGKQLIEHFAPLHGGIIRVEVPQENRIYHEDRSPPDLPPMPLTHTLRAAPPKP